MIKNLNVQIWQKAKWRSWWDSNMDKWVLWCWSSTELTTEDLTDIWNLKSYEQLDTHRTKDYLLFSQGGWANSYSVLQLWSSHQKSVNKSSNIMSFRGLMRSPSNPHNINEVFCFDTSGNITAYPSSGESHLSLHHCRCINVTNKCLDILCFDHKQ